MTTNLPPVESNTKPVQTKATKAWVGAVIAAVIAGLGSLNTALLDGSVSGQDWLNVAISVLFSLGGVGGSVYAVTNKTKN